MTRKPTWLTTSGITGFDLARHDRAAGLQLRQVDLVQAAARPGSEHPMSLQILVSLADVRLSTPDSST
jgi:hypothetical protein